MECQWRLWCTTMMNRQSIVQQEATKKSTTSFKLGLHHTIQARTIPHLRTNAGQSSTSPAPPTLPFLVVAVAISGAYSYGFHAYVGLTYLLHRQFNYQHTVSAIATKWCWLKVPNTRMLVLYSVSTRLIHSVTQQMHCLILAFRSIVAFWKYVKTSHICTCVSTFAYVSSVHVTFVWAIRRRDEQNTLQPRTHQGPVLLDGGYTVDIPRGFALWQIHSLEPETQ